MLAVGPAALADTPGVAGSLVLAVWLDGGTRGLIRIDRPLTQEAICACIPKAKGGAPGDLDHGIVFQGFRKSLNDNTPNRCATLENGIELPRFFASDRRARRFCLTMGINRLAIV